MTMSPSTNRPLLASLAAGCATFFLTVSLCSGEAYAQATPPSVPKVAPKPSTKPAQPTTTPADGEKPSKPDPSSPNSEEPAPESTPGQRDPSDPINPEQPAPDALPDGRDPGPPIWKGNDNKPTGTPMKRAPGEKQLAPPKPPPT